MWNLVKNVEIVYITEPIMKHAGFKCEISMVCQPFQLNSMCMPMFSFRKLQCCFHHAIDHHDAHTRSYLSLQLPICQSHFSGPVDFMRNCDSSVYHYKAQLNITIIKGNC